MAAPHLRHRSSLQGIIDFSTKAPLETDQRVKARNRFYSIVEHFDTAHNYSNKNPYNRSRLIRYTFEYAMSETSKDNVLRAFIEALELSTDEVEDDDLEQLGPKFFDFADYLLDNFFLPLKASSKKTPQPSPTIYSAIQGAQGDGETQAFPGTASRVANLRRACLLRDRHRCVISRRFDLQEMITRWDRDGHNAEDDDGVLLVSSPSDVLEVAHILPHSLTHASAGSQLNASKRAALAVLNMFDDGVTHLIEGANIDRSTNAITLTQALHGQFGDFRVYFEPVPDQPPHTYRIRSFLPPPVDQMLELPVTRTLYLTSDRTIDPPSPRLLAVHRAIAHILRLSAAGEYIDRLLRDADENGVRADGSTELGRLVTLRLGLSIAG
ncbi:hypothetical protein GGS23DRAFT_558544 [Durotheca rogersii]|uniref:uncharacterized protein n=1 Tax=Durotheca rogersii TaxID=419775 RepID=UPI00221E7E7A|nr:uncharacterized protein GGS23DRAFT_558544 [Durotheca rogersii]KAI5865282.1 hypothetical protein GGS23DRAFT_558544 [Durotheca rogersii]